MVGCNPLQGTVGQKNRPRGTGSWAIARSPKIRGKYIRRPRQPTSPERSVQSRLAAPTPSSERASLVLACRLDRNSAKVKAGDLARGVALAPKPDGLLARAPRNRLLAAQPHGLRRVAANDVLRTLLLRIHPKPL